jgi:hypothetical protein
MESFAAITTTVKGVKYAWIVKPGSMVNYVKARDTYGVEWTDTHASFDDSVYWALACAACGTEWECHYPTWWNDCAPEWLDEMCA